jgi:hypothetical protein
MFYCEKTFYLPLQMFQPFFWRVFFLVTWTACMFWFFWWFFPTHLEPVLQFFGAFFLYYVINWCSRKKITFVDDLMCSADDLMCSGNFVPWSPPSCISRAYFDWCSVNLPRPSKNSRGGHSLNKSRVPNKSDAASKHLRSACRYFLCL